MAMGMIALLSALWGGVFRFGWDFPPLSPGMSVFHGPLMVSGFLGTLIGLERAVAIGQKWIYTGPLLSGLGALLLIAGLPGRTGLFLITIASLILVIAFIRMILQHPALYTATMGLGALSWLIGNLLWFGELPVHRIVFWWCGFLVLTIAGERLELARFGFLSKGSRKSFQIAIGLLLSGLILASVSFDSGIRLAGAGFLALSLWLIRYDIARRTIRQTGLTRFIAICLLSGHAWLGVSGLLTIFFGGMSSGPEYDAILHALFLGFAFSMIFGHAPIIFPAVTGRPISYHPRFYLHFILLQATLFLRIAGDLAGWTPGRQWGGLFNVFAVLLFLANTGYAVLRPDAPGGASRKTY